MPKFFIACDEGYAVLKKSVEDLKKKNVAAYDWSGLFLNKKDNIFIDACHVNSKGNKIVAEAMEKNDTGANAAGTNGVRSRL